MINKVVVLCTDPWENFLPWVIQSHSREFFEKLCKRILRSNQDLCCREFSEIYGDCNLIREENLFQEGTFVQMLYVRSRSEWVLKEIFEKSDLVIMGVPTNKKVFDKMFMTIFPWIHKIMFLMEETDWGENCFLKMLYNEYKIKDTQVIRVKREIGEKLF